MSDESGTTRLPAPTRQRAMDWSLVLASQGIAHWITSPDEAGRWSLQVNPADVSRASQAIRQYELENRPRPWQRSYFEGRIIHDRVSLVWGAALVAIHILAGRYPFIEQAGVMHGTDVTRGEWWRLITATQLHADWGHLASNLSIGLVLLGLVMGRWGTATGMLAAMLAGMGGNAANWLIRPEIQSLGASTVVMGCIGLLSVLPHSQNPARGKTWANLLGGLSGAAMLFMLLGLDPRADVLAHAGGFVSGLILAQALRSIPALTKGRVASLCAAILLAALVLVTWTLAVARTGPEG